MVGVVPQVFVSVFKTAFFYSCMIKKKGVMDRGHRIERPGITLYHVVRFLHHFFLLIVENKKIKTLCSGNNQSRGIIFCEISQVHMQKKYNLIDVYNIKYPRAESRIITRGWVE